ncbi:MAG: DUF3300 domain-containing protein [Candidatus Korobacteraceae bacterium]
MKFNIGTKRTGWLKQMLHGILQPGQAAAVTGQRIGELARQGLAVVLSALMIMIPMAQGQAFAESDPAAVDSEQQVPQAQPLSTEQLDQLVAPIALYPDSLLAQVLAASTYPTQVVEADRWLQAQGNAPADQIAAGAENQNWDPSVKALTAFPTVLAQMDRNIQWTTDLGNTYYNQPQDVMDAVQAMRQKAQVAGQLRSTPQQVVTNDAGAITIAPANPTVVYVPVYNPWAVYGAPVLIYPGYYYAPPADVFWGGLAIGFGVGVAVGLFAHWGWGWGHWGMGWGRHCVFFNHNTYITRSTTVINRGFNRPGGPPRNFAGRRGAYPRSAGNFNRSGGFNRPGYSYRGASGASRPGSVNYGRPSGAINHSSASASRPAGGFNRPGSSYRGAPGVNRPGSVNYGRPSGAINHSSASASRPAGNYGRPSGGPGASFPRASMSRGSGANFGGGHPSGGSRITHSGGGGHPGGGSARGGGHSGHGGGGRRG